MSQQEKLSLESIIKRLGNYSGEYFSNFDSNFIKSDNHNSAVLIPLNVYKKEIHLLYTVRSSTLDRHSGQVSFPGGLIESKDKTPMEAALRETEEEIGLCKKQIQIIGCLPLLNSITGYIIYPVVGVIDSMNDLKIAETEVERVINIPLSWLMDETHVKLNDYVSKDGKVHKVWYFDVYNGELLWGISAKITKDFLELIKK